MDKPMHGVFALHGNAGQRSAAAAPEGGCLDGNLLDDYRASNPPAD